MKDSAHKTQVNANSLRPVIQSSKPRSLVAWIAKISLAVLLTPYVLPIVHTVGWKTQYTYANEYQSLALSQALELKTPKNSFVIELETESQIEGEDTVTFEVITENGTKESGLEIAGDESITGKYFTAPIHFDPVRVVRVNCIWCETLKQPRLHITALDTRSSVEKLSYQPEALYQNAHAATVDFPVISRAEWGADESLRYADSPVWVNIFKKQENATTSEATKKQLEKNIAIDDYLRKNFPEESVLNEVIRTENGHKLVWPIEKTKYVREIVIHHTAEDNIKSLSDEELMRSMYYYHTISRGWGDIGYQYIIGQRGKVYEGRAGGDYNVGAHVTWNNRGTVGISVIGNFEKDTLVKEQRATIQKFLLAISKKYGIDTNTDQKGHKACKVEEECLTRDFDIKSLVGHRDVGYTSCPGANLYKALTETFIPELNGSTRNTTLIANSVYKPETLKKTESTPEISKPIPEEALGPTIRIKLSVPTNLKKIELEATEWNPILGWETKSGKVNFSKISVRKVGNKVETTMGGRKYKTNSISLSATTVRINNWIRIPAWDKEKQYNDNEFRGKIEIRIEDNKLIAINELPLEMYLRWLAEFSNGENSEKAKTILVSARSYALFYTDPKNRKFPGKPYDGSDDPDVFQKYLGYGYEKRSATTLKFIEATRGEIITYKDIPVKPWYFSQSSGRTLSAKEYCESRKTNGTLPSSTTCSDIPYLQSVGDPGGEGKTQLGHGVGVSGIGASYYATQGWDYKKIIKYYLNGTEVVKKY